MSRMYRFELKVRSPRLPAAENDLIAAAGGLWPFSGWDVEPDGQYWGLGEGSFSGREAPFAAQLAKTVRKALGTDAVVEVVATDLDDAPRVHYSFGAPGVGDGLPWRDRP
jgi:hypothetical protein